MPHFKDSANRVWWLDDDETQAAEVLRHGLTPISDDQADALRNPAKDFVTVIAELQAAVDTEYQRRMQAIADGYPAYERESWPIQLTEANTYATDNTAPTPWLDACAGARGIAKAELAQRVQAKDAAYREVSGVLTGVFQRHEDAIAELKTLEQAQAYDISQHWPMEPKKG